MSGHSGFPVYPAGPWQLISTDWLLTWPGARSFQQPSFIHLSRPPVLPPAFWGGERGGWSRGCGMVSYWEVPILLSVACWEGVEGGLGREGIPNGVQLTPTITSFASSHPFFTYSPTFIFLKGRWEQLSIPTPCRGHVVLYIMKMRFTRF